MYRQKNEDIARRILEIEQEVKSLENGQALSKVYDEQEELQRLLNSHCDLTMLMANIGIGKTMATRALATHGRGRAILEHVDGNPALARYYQEWVKHNLGRRSKISRSADRLQIDLPNRRFHQIIIEHLKHPNEPLIFDRSHYEDLIFIEALARAGIFELQQASSLKQYFKDQKLSLEQFYDINLTPKLLIFLRRNFETGWRRQSARNREMEVGGGLSRDFYQHLHACYEELVDQEKLREQFGYNGPIAILGCDDVDVTDLSNSRGVLYLVRSIKEALRIAYES